MQISGRGPKGRQGGLRDMVRQDLAERRHPDLEDRLEHGLALEQGDSLVGPLVEHQDIGVHGGDHLEGGFGVQRGDGGRLRRRLGWLRG